MEKKLTTGGGMSTEFRVGFVGCGRIAHFHADVLQNLGHKIAAASARPGSETLPLFKQKYSVPEAFEDFRTMPKKVKMNAVIVCTPWDETEKIISEVIHWGLPILVEKPLALSAEKIQELMHEAGPLSRNVLVGYNRRFYDFIPELKAAFQDLDLLSVHVSLPEAVKTLVEAYGERARDHVLTIQSSHWIDLVRYLLGDLECVLMMRSKGDHQRVASYHGLLKTKRTGIPIHYESDFDTPQQIAITFTAKDRIWKICPGETLSIYRGMDCLEPTAETPVRRYLPRLEKEIPADTAYKPGFNNQMAYFLERYVKKEKGDVTGATMADALRVTELCEEIEGYVYHTT